MKELTLQDLSDDELVAWIDAVVTGTVTVIVLGPEDDD